LSLIDVCLLFTLTSQQSANALEKAPAEKNVQQASPSSSKDQKPQANTGVRGRKRAAPAAAPAIEKSAKVIKVDKVVEEKKPAPVTPTKVAATETKTPPKGKAATAGNKKSGKWRRMA
jgi:hypothetical protein